MEEKEFLTIVSNTGNKILAHAMLLVNSVKIAVIIIATKMMTAEGAPTRN